VDLEAIDGLGSKFKAERFFLNAIRVLLSALMLVPIVSYALYLFSWRDSSQEELIVYLRDNGWYVLVAAFGLVGVNLIMNWSVDHARRSFGRRAYRHTLWFAGTRLDEATTGCVHFFNNRGELMYRAKGTNKLFDAMRFTDQLARHLTTAAEPFMHLMVPYASGNVNATFISLLTVSPSGIAVFDLKFWQGALTLYDKGGYWYAFDERDARYPVFINDDEVLAAINAISPSFIHESDITVHTVLMSADELRLDTPLPTNRSIFRADDFAHHIKRSGPQRLDEVEISTLCELFETYRFPDDALLADCQRAHAAKEERYRLLLKEQLGEA
jgi:hypothetical protein